MNAVKYKFYATILDAFQNYLNSDKNWETFYGFSDDPKISLEEYNEKSYQELIDKINRVPFESEAADKGTAFNEVIDCIIENRKSEKMEITKLFKGVMETDYDEKHGVVGVVPIKTNEVVGVRVRYNVRTFDFPIRICKEFSDYFKGAITQYYTEAILPTRYGNVLLYGYIDELMPESIHDIKTTNKYNAYKYRNNWQHKVYPYCITQSGSDIRTFEYNITDFKNTYIETYKFNPEEDTSLLIDHCELFIDFLEANRNKITDKKIFNEI